MSTFPADFPFSLDATTSRLELMQLCAAEVGYAQGVPTAGTSSSLTDTSVDSPFVTNDANTQYINAWVYIEADTGGQNIGTCKRITSYTVASNQIGFPAMGSTVATTMTYGIYFGVPPVRQGVRKGWDEYINGVLRMLRQRQWVLLTLVDDGDMEASGTSNWAQTNCTATKVTANVTAGARALRVQNSSANGYAQSNSVAVIPSKTVEVVVDFTVGSGTAKLVLWDVTNGAEINSYTSSEKRTSYFWLQEIVPSTCYQVALRLQGVEASADVYWDTATLRLGDASEIALPSSILKPSLEELIAYGGGVSTGTSNVCLAQSRRPEIITWANIREDTGADVPFVVEYAPYPPTASHLFVQLIQPYTQLTTDDATTGANGDWVKAWALAQACADMGRKEDSARWLAEAQTLHKSYYPRLRARRRMMRPF